MSNFTHIWFACDFDRLRKRLSAGRAIPPSLDRHHKFDSRTQLLLTPADVERPVAAPFRLPPCIQLGGISAMKRPPPLKKQHKILQLDPPALGRFFYLPTPTTNEPTTHGPLAGLRCRVATFAQGRTPLGWGQGTAAG